MSTKYEIKGKAFRALTNSRRSLYMTKLYPLQKKLQSFSRGSELQGSILEVTWMNKDQINFLRFRFPISIKFLDNYQARKELGSYMHTKVSEFFNSRDNKLGISTGIETDDPDIYLRIDISGDLKKAGL